jgi:predicted transcriptional regulator
MTPAEIKSAAESEGVSVQAIRKRIRGNVARGCSDLLAKNRGGHYKITESQAKWFWVYVCCGYTTKAAADSVQITFAQGKNIRDGKTWNHITGKDKKVYGEY